MKLIVTIPAYNEEENIADVIKEVPRQIDGIDQVEVLVLDDGSRDNTVEVCKQAGANYIVSHRSNLGLAKTFSDAVSEALKLGADVIVNTDGDNHYDQSKIPLLVEPIVKHRADIVIGSRKIGELEKMPFLNKYGNMIGSYITTKIAGIPKVDVSTGFRSYSREAALRLNLLSNHTYTHAALVSAADTKMVIQEVPIKARPVTRKSRLIKNIPDHIMRAGTVIVRNIVLYKPLRVFLSLGILIFLIGFVFVIRFIYFYFTGAGSGHIQSIVLAGVLIIVGFNVAILGMIASAIGWNRKTIEEVLYRVKKIEYQDNKNKN